MAALTVVVASVVAVAEAMGMAVASLNNLNLQSWMVLFQTLRGTR